MIEFIEHHKRVNFLFGDFSLVLLLLPPSIRGLQSGAITFTSLYSGTDVWYYYFKLPLFGDYSLVLLLLPPSVEEDHFRYGHMATRPIHEENDVQNTDKKCPYFYTL